MSVINLNDEQIFGASSDKTHVIIKRVLLFSDNVYIQAGKVLSWSQSLKILNLFSFSLTFRT